MTTLHSVAHQCAGGYSAEQLEAIKLFGRKDLSFGCLFKLNRPDEVWKVLGNPEPSDNIHKFIDEEFEYDYIFALPGGSTGVRSVTGLDVSESIFTEILGHIPHLEDLFRVAEENGWDMQVYLDRLNIFEVVPTPDMNPNKAHSFLYNPTLPLLDQPSLPEIISLFK